MAGKLKVRKDQIGNTVHFDYCGSSRSILLTEDTSQKELEIVQFVGIDVFEAKEAEKK